MSIVASNQFAKEGGHFYLPGGTPYYDVPNKSRPGESRPATTRDALKVGAEPSVSTVLKVAAAPQLTRWLIEQALDAALTLPRLPDESLDDFKARALRDSQEQGKKARDRGTEIHAAIERHCQCLPYDEQFGPHVRTVTEALAEVGIYLLAGQPERSFCVPGMFGGKIDWSSPVAVLDFKGIDDDKLEGKLGYDEHIRQLAAYDVGSGYVNLPPSRRLINVFIGRGSGGVRLKEWTRDEACHAYQEFLCLLRFYRLTKGFPVDGLREAA